MNYVASDDYVRLAGLIELVLPCTTAELFSLSKNYTIVEGVDDAKGKWPSQLGNGWFTDSSFLVDDMIDMTLNKIFARLDNTSIGKELTETMKELAVMIKAKELG